MNENIVDGAFYIVGSAIAFFQQKDKTNKSGFAVTFVLILALFLILNWIVTIKIGDPPVIVTGATAFILGSLLDSITRLIENTEKSLEEKDLFELMKKDKK